MHEAGEPIGYAALDSGEDQTEVGAVYVLPQYRGSGRGTALTRAAIAAAGDVRDVWICADAEDRPQHLYARLGFRPVLHTMEFLRLPDGLDRTPQRSGQPGCQCTAARAGTTMVSCRRRTASR